MPRVTSRDVAREAGVSQTTVSFVLSGSSAHRISGETRDHVLETARRLGYVPSAAARSLRAGRSNVVVCLLPDLPVAEALEVTKRQLSAALGRDGYVCLFLDATSLPDGVSGVWQHVDAAAVVSFAALSEADSAALRAAAVPVIDDVLRPDGARLEGLDQRQIGYLQVTHLAALGHRRIGFAAIADPREAPFSTPRGVGAQRACADLGLPEPVVADIEYSPASAREMLRAWRALDHPITAVAAFNDLVALAVLGACRIEGLRVPEDLAIIGVDDIPAASLAVPPLTTVAMDLSIPARNLAAQVISLIKGQSPAAIDTDTQVLRVIDRESV